MAKCKVCSGNLKSERRDIERIVDGYTVRVLNLNVNVCTACGDITPKWWTSFEKIDRMLSARLKKKPFNSVTWEDLISEDVAVVIFPG